MAPLLHQNIRRSRECATLIGWLAALPGEHILDIGCGDGYFSSRIAKQGAKVAGIDIQEKQLRRAWRNYQGDNSQFHYMDAAEMSFADRSFDKVISLCVIEHFPDDRRVIQEVKRVLRPGGLFVFSADSLSCPGISEAERERHRRNYAINTFYTREKIQEKFADTGFEIEQFQYILTTPLSLSLVRLSWHADRWHRSLILPRLLTHFLLATIGQKASNLSERRTGLADRGLTLLVKARKR